jgi:DNA-nicking Smr family endonuclease
VGPTRDPDAEAWEVLLRFVRGEGRFDLSDQDEWVEGCWHELDPTVMRRLRRGEFSVQGHVDLHGLVVEEAHVALAGFVRQGRLAGKRCLLVVHGRGHHSKDRTPVLKERVVAWLSRGRLAREILAFCTARPHDGGAGALYVLLRRGGEQRPPARRRDGEARPAGTAGEAATAGQGRGAGPGARGPLTRGEARRGMQRRPDRTDPLAPLCRGP